MNNMLYNSDIMKLYFASLNDYDDSISFKNEDYAVLLKAIKRIIPDEKFEDMGLEFACQSVYDDIIGINYKEGYSIAFWEDADLPGSARIPKYFYIDTDGAEIFSENMKIGQKFDWEMLQKVTDNQVNGTIGQVKENESDEKKYHILTDNFEAFCVCSKDDILKYVQVIMVGQT